MYNNELSTDTVNMILRYFTKSSENAEYWPSSIIAINNILYMSTIYVLSKHTLTK